MLGLIGKKVGMTQVFDAQGKLIPVTVIKVEDNVVIADRTDEKLGVDLFKEVAYVDVTGVSKGKGYQGGMKRYGFGGGRKTHGSKFHRDLGGTAMSSTPAHTFKGHRMAGHMGNEQVTVQNLKLVAVDSEMQVLMVKGAIPGPTDSTVVIKKAVKK